MIQKIKIALCTLCLAAIYSTTAQSLAQYKERLSLFDSDETSEFARYVNVAINEDESSQRALAALIEQNLDDEGEPKEVSKQGYRIGIFFDNGATARAKAVKIVSRCDSLLSDIPVTMSYDNPYFKVTAGYCISQEEAVMTLHRVQRYFPSAYLTREHITPADIIKVYQMEQEKELAAEEQKSTEERKKEMPELKEFDKPLPLR